MLTNVDKSWERLTKVNKGWERLKQTNEEMQDSVSQPQFNL